MYILLLNLDEKCYYSNHNMYYLGFSNSKFIDVKPNFNLKNGYGRIIMVQWNSFLRKIKRYLWSKNKNNKPINKFWNKTRFQTIEKCNPYLSKEIIHNIFEYI